MSPRSEALNEQLRSESRAKIVEHALRLFAERGVEGTSMAAIARAAGISPGLIYHYFAGKDALLRAIIERSLADVQASFAAAEAVSPPGERIEQLVRASFEIVRRNRDFWRLSYGLRMQPAVLARLGPEIVEGAMAIERGLQRLLEDAGVAEPALEAAVLFGTIDGVAQHYVLDPERYPLAAVAERIVARYRGREELSREESGR
jgi:AcrR family transcriptional regulator